MAATHKTYPPKTDFSDQTITNVQKIQLKEIVSDDETSVSLNLGTDAGDDFKVATSKLVVEGDTGRVGIGTATPASTMEIEGSSGDLILEIDNNASNSANFQIQNGAGNARVDLVMNDGSANTTITMKGQKAGIGDTSPTYGLDVNGTARVVGAVTLDSTLGCGAITSTGTVGATGATVTGDVVFDNGDNAGKDMTWDISEDSLILNDDVQLSCGTDRDLRLYHTGTHAYMNVVTGDLNIRTNGSESAIVCTSNAGVATYYDNAKKTETTSTGITITGTLVADDIDVDGTIKLDSGVSDETCSGVTASFVAGETLNRGDVVYYKPADSRMWKAVATAAATSRAVAMAAADISGGATGLFLLKGVVKDAATFPTFVAGDVIYTDEGSGGPPTKTAPSTDGDFVQVIGWALDADKVYFCPDSTVIEVA